MTASVESLRAMFPQWSDSELESIIQEYAGDIERILPDLLERPVSDAQLARFLSSVENMPPAVPALSVQPPTAAIVDPPNYQDAQTTSLYPPVERPQPRLRRGNGMTTPLLYDSI